MNDLIYRQAAIEAIQNHFNPQNEEMPPEIAAVLAGVGVVLGHLPSAQPEIILCKYCKHRHEAECPMYHEEDIEWDDDGYIERETIYHDWTEDDGYCDRGERRTDEQIH